MTAQEFILECFLAERILPLQIKDIQPFHKAFIQHHKVGAIRKEKS